MPDASPALDRSMPHSTAAAFPRRVHVVLLAGMVALVVSGFLLASRNLAGVGFPLDDAWIHQTYARSLGQRGEWAFIPGQPSAGSTSPLWSALLALGYWLRLNPFTWTFSLGSLSLLGLALAGEAWFRTERQGLGGLIPWAGLFLAGEWHLAWSAVSGMETLLFALLILLALWQMALAHEGSDRRWLSIGLLIGASVWVRPDGLTLLGPALVVLALVSGPWRARLTGFAWLAAGVGLFCLPYLLLNLRISGALLPNTFYAKQAEYAAMRALPLAQRFLNEVSLPLVGAGLFLLPGFAAYAWRSWQARRWAGLAAVTWFLGYALLYALRLPVTYQYGRYFMPAMPVYFVLGLLGSWELAARLRGARVSWLLARVAILSGAAVWLGFLGLGASHYAGDVAFIQADMVAPARWVAANTPPQALIAVHDIGAMGYFGQRRILDLAGLVSPEVIPFIRDETRLAAWLDRQQVAYLVVLSGWYDHLAGSRTPLYQSTPAPGQSPMLIYRWRP